MPRTLVPNVPAAGCAKAAGFRNRMLPLAGLIDSPRTRRRAPDCRAAWRAAPPRAMSFPVRIVSHDAHRRLVESRRLGAGGQGQSVRAVRRSVAVVESGMAP